MALQAGRYTRVELLMRELSHNMLAELYSTLATRYYTQAGYIKSYRSLSASAVDLTSGIKCIHLYSNQIQEERRNNEQHQKL